MTTPESYLTAIKAHYGTEPNTFRDRITDTVQTAMEECEVMMVICFWRPIFLKGKLINNPLAVLDCSTVKKESMVPCEIYSAPYYIP